MRILNTAALVLSATLPLFAEDAPRISEPVPTREESAPGSPASDASAAAPARVTPPAVSAYDQTNPAGMRRSRQMQRADRRFQISAGMTYGGMALLVASPFLFQEDLDLASELMSLAFVAYMVGEPIMGGAATSLNRLASALPGYRDPGSGWRPYAWSHVLKGAGAAWFMYVFLRNLEVYPPFFIITSDLRMQDLYPAFALLGAGFVSEGYALYQFHSRRNRAMESLHASLSWAPTLKRSSDGGVKPGLAVSLAF